MTHQSEITSTRYVAYYRVSTDRQGASGLGLEAQRAAVTNFVEGLGLAIESEHTEIESGRRPDRPALKAAISSCRSKRATLVIAKLDRLARNVHFVSGLMETGVSFLALDMPTADRFMLHVYAAMAEEEARRISQRTIAALRAAKARGQRLGINGRVLADKEMATAHCYALAMAPIIERIGDQGDKTVRQICRALNEAGIMSRNGRRWHPTSVARMLKRLRLPVDGHPSIEATGFRPPETHPE